MYHDGNKWHAHDRYCFVSPIPSEECYIEKPMHEPLMGRMEYPNDYLVSKESTQEPSFRSRPTASTSLT